MLSVICWLLIHQTSCNRLGGMNVVKCLKDRNTHSEDGFEHQTLHLIYKKTELKNYCKNIFNQYQSQNRQKFIRNRNDPCTSIMWKKLKQPKQKQFIDSSIEADDWYTDFRALLFDNDILPLKYNNDNNDVIVDSIHDISYLNVFGS
jgi:hypothetical protein